MQATPRRSPSGSSPQQTAQRPRPTIADITGKGLGLPNKYVFHAVEGFGKTSLGAQTKKPIFIQTAGETGLETLIESGRLPEIPHFPAFQHWEDIIGAIETLRVDDHPYRTLVMDTANGAEALCHQFICNRDFNGDWGEKGFASYKTGYEVSLPEWTNLLMALDRLRVERKMTIFLLCHTKVKPFRNPEGADYDRYTVDMHDKTWGLTHKWADAVFFGNFSVTVKTKSSNAQTGKATGGTSRVLYTERQAAFDAKNRFGLAPEIDLGNSPEEAWGNLMEAFKIARQVPAQTATEAQ
jgi:hypothetical protein